jgi:hypothetical protein
MNNKSAVRTSQPKNSEFDNQNNNKSVPIAFGASSGGEKTRLFNN